ncbi:MAG: choice-of-anchor V domain-containing protein, partial [Candidatus Thermoplasmatota archaeon]|nr:choice-of-anchor V domain-containing protein [Candidatus Thermoplasmatota archaeon]
MNTLARAATIVLATLLLLALPTHEGYSSGIHNQASNGCSCHYSGSAPTINHNFPTTYNGGQTYSIQISANGGVSGSGGGFNVVVDKGSLSTPGVGIMAVKVDSSGLSATHTTSSYRSWSFDWTAPSTGSGTVDVEIAVNTVNGNSASSGDAWTTSSITIPEPGPSNT